MGLLSDLLRGVASQFQLTSPFGAWAEKVSAELDQADAAVDLFGDGSDGDIVISALNTPTDGARNANSFTILPGASVLVPLGDHFIVRARTKITIDGPIDGSQRMNFAVLDFFWGAPASGTTPDERFGGWPCDGRWLLHAVWVRGAAGSRGGGDPRRGDPRTTAPAT